MSKGLGLFAVVTGLALLMFEKLYLSNSLLFTIGAIMLTIGILINFLRKELNKQDLLWFQKTHLIQKETGRHLADIGIDKSVGIELKLNLSKLSEADRLIQQVRRFLEEYEEGVIVVLCGRSDREKVDYVKHVFKNMNEIGKRVEIITKRHTKQKKRKEEFPFEINLFR